MMPHGGFDVRNLFIGSNLALLLIYITAAVLVGALAITFKGSVVV